MKTKKYYVISACDGLTKEEALDLIKTWSDGGDLTFGTKVYEIVETTKVFEPKLELKEL